MIYKIKNLNYQYLHFKIPLLYLRNFKMISIVNFLSYKFNNFWFEKNYHLVYKLHPLEYIPENIQKVFINSLFILKYFINYYFHLIYVRILKIPFFMLLIKNLLSFQLLNLFNTRKAFFFYEVALLHIVHS